jgi:hypothetical protein
MHEEMSICGAIMQPSSCLVSRPGGEEWGGASMANSMQNNSAQRQFKIDRTYRRETGRGMCMDTNQMIL